MSAANKYLSLLTKGGAPLETHRAVPSVLWLERGASAHSLGAEAHKLAVQRHLGAVGQQTTEPINVILGDFDAITEAPSVDAILCSGGERGVDAMFAKTVSKVCRRFTGPIYAVSTEGDLSALEMFDHVFYRGSEGLESLPLDNCTICPDLATSLDAAPVNKIEGAGKRVVFALDAGRLGPDTQHLLRSFAALIDDISAGGAAVVQLVAFSHRDVALNRQLAALCSATALEDRYLQRPEAMLKFLSSVDYVVSMSYHAALFAIMQRVPFAALAPDTATKGLLAGAGASGRAFGEDKLAVLDAVGLKALLFAPMPALAPPPAFDFEPLRRMIVTRKRKKLSYTRARLRSPSAALAGAKNMKPSAPTTSMGDAFDLAYAFARRVSPAFRDELARRVSAGEALEAIAADVFSDKPIAFPALDIERKVVVDMFHVSFDDDDYASKALLQFDKTILGKPLGDYLIFDPDVCRTLDARDSLAANDVVLYPRAWMGIVGTPDAVSLLMRRPLSDLGTTALASCRALLCYSKTARDAITTMLTPRMAALPPIYVVDPAIDCAVPAFAMRTFNGLIMQKAPGRLCQLSVDAHRNPAGVSKACLEKVGSAVGCACGDSVTVVGADKWASAVWMIDQQDGDDYEPWVSLLHQVVASNHVALVLRTPAREELLGPDYPGFYSSLGEASELARSPDVLTACWNHLGAMDKSRFSLSKLAERVQDAILQTLAQI